MKLQNEFLEGLKEDWNKPEGISSSNVDWLFEYAEELQEEIKTLERMISKSNVEFIGKLPKGPRTE